MLGRCIPQSFRIVNFHCYDWEVLSETHFTMLYMCISQESSLTLDRDVGLPGGASGEETGDAGDIRDEGSIPGSGRSPGGGHHNPLQYSCLENPIDRGAWWATVH